MILTLFDARVSPEEERRDSVRVPENDDDAGNLKYKEAVYVHDWSTLMPAKLS